jgi:CubicO group peptidase (beta-lactamase class C family)
MQELIDRIKKTAIETEFSGVVSIFKDSSPVFSKAFGYRDIKNKVANTTDTIFGIASGTKLFTALGIGVLIDQGKIALNTTIGEISREYSGFIDEHATIQHLLTHTSGIYDYYDEEIEQDWENFQVGLPWYQLETPSDYYPLFNNQAMKFRPGERYSYSNGGYVFLGILIEKITGQLFRDFIAENVLKVAKMRRSGFFAFNDLPENTANGYHEDRKTTNIYQLPIRGGGDGGMFTTTDDLCVFWVSFLSNKILSARLTATYLKTHCKLSDKIGYGCGIYKRLDDSMYATMGSDAGVGFESRHFIQDKLTVNILSNLTNGESALRKVVLSYF